MKKTSLESIENKYVKSGLAGEKLRKALIKDNIYQKLLKNIKHKLLKI